MDAPSDVRIRRRDLAGVGEAERLKVNKGLAAIGPGRWELMLTPPAAYYVSGFTYPGVEREERGRPDGWNAITVSGGHGTALFRLSGRPGAAHGTVKNGNDPAVGAPVFLEAYDPDQRKRLKDVVVTRTNTRGQYDFTSLAPGAYRVFASFEYQLPEEAVFDRVSASLIRMDEGGEVTQDLDLYKVR